GETGTISLCVCPTVAAVYDRQLYRSSKYGWTGFTEPVPYMGTGAPACLRSNSGRRSSTIFERSRLYEKLCGPRLVLSLFCSPAHCMHKAEKPRNHFTSGWVDSPQSRPWPVVWLTGSWQTIE